MIHPVNDRYKLAMDYCTYSLNHKSQKYDNDEARNSQKWNKRPTLQRKYLMFDAVELINILSFLNDFKLAWNQSSVHGGAAMWPFPLIMNKLVKAARNFWPWFKAKRTSTDQRNANSLLLRR